MVVVVAAAGERPSVACLASSLPGAAQSSADCNAAVCNMRGAVVTVKKKKGGAGAESTRQCVCVCVCVCV